MKTNEDDTAIIPCPEKGVVYKGFNLQEAMGLADDNETYEWVFHALAHIYLQAQVCSTVFGTCLLKPVSTVQYCGTANQKMLLVKLLERYVSPIRNHYFF